MAPWNKDPGPLAKSTKECELLKKKVDALVKECNKVIGNKKLKDKETKLDQLYQNCLDNRKLVDNQNENFENLKEEDEQTKVKNYDQKKTQEVNKLSAMKVILNETLTKLLPDTTEEDFIKKHKQAEDKEDDEVKEKDEKEEEKGNKAGAKPVDDEEDEEEEDDDEEEEDDEDEEEDDDEEEEDEEEESKKPSARPTRVPSGAASKHDDEEDDEEEETEEEDDEDEEDDEEEEDEEERPVPAKRGADSRTKKKREEEDDDEKDEDEEEEDDDDDEEDDEEDDDEEDEDEEEDDDRKKLVKGDDKSKKVDTSAKKKKGADKKEEDVEVTQQTLHKFEAIDDYDAEEEGDLMFTKGTVLTVLETREDGWWMAENDAGEKGLVPSTYLQKYNPYEGVQHKDDGDEEDDDDDEQDEDDDDEDMSPRASQRIDTKTKKNKEKENYVEKDDDDEEDDDEDEDYWEHDDKKKLIKGDNKKPKKVGKSAKKKKGADKKYKYKEVKQQTKYNKCEDVLYKDALDHVVLQPSVSPVKKDEYEDEEEDDDDEEEEDDDEEKEKDKEIIQHKFEAIDDLDSEEKEDLKLTKGTIVTILKTREDGWWMVKNEAGKKGLVPSTYLKKFNPFEDVQYKDVLDPATIRPSVLPVKKDEDEKEEEDDDDEEEEADDDDEEDKEEDDCDVEEEEEEEEDDEIIQHKFEAIDDLDSEEKEDLKLTKGTIVTVLKTREDGWWMVENEEGKKGLVPSTFLKKYIPCEDAQHKDDLAVVQLPVLLKKTEDISDEKMSKKLWGSLRKAVQDTTVSDVLHAMGAVPSGFRKSTLSRKFNEGDQYRLSNYLIPKLSQSNLMYSDLFFEPSTSKIRLRSTRNERVITIVSCQQIPPPGAGVEVEGRHIKMCLFDGQQILSNIHSVTVASVDKSQRSWAFSTRTADNMDPFSHAEVFFRSNNTTSNIGILFELCISYSRVSTSEKGEFSCGWVHLPMFDVNGTATPNKSYDLYVNGGTPYEKGIEVDPAISRRRQSASSSALASLISGNKQPRLVVKLSQPKQQHKELMDTLPDTVMGATTLLPLYSYYRCCLADTLLRDRLDLDSTELIHSPLLKQFPKIADTPDLMKLFRTSWFEKLKDVRRAEKSSFFFGLNPLRDEEYMKEVFRQVFMDSVYPVQHVATLPAYRMGDEDNDKIRQETLVRYNETRRGNKSALATLLSPNMVFHPMILDEVAYSVIGPSCLNKPHSVS